MMTNAGTLAALDALELNVTFTSLPAAALIVTVPWTLVAPSVAFPGTFKVSVAVSLSVTSRFHGMDV